MKREKEHKRKLSLKGQLTIFIKKHKPLPGVVYLIVCIIMLAVMIVTACTEEITVVEAGEELQNSVLRLTMVGDINIDERIRSMATSHSYSYLFAGIKKYWADSDYVFANIDGPVLRYEVSHYTSRLDKDEEAIYLRPRALRGMMESGINLFSFASEDTFNYGRTGIESTISLLEDYELDYLGIASDNTQDISQELSYTICSENGEEESHSIAVISVNDVILERSSANASRAGLINSTMETLYESVYQASVDNDYVIVYVHFGDEGSAEVTDEQKQIAHALIDAGAMLVVGSHSHYVQTMETYGNGLIVYGLGDFISSDTYSNTLDSVLMDFIVNNDNSVSVYLTPLHISEGRPEVASSSLYQNRVISSLTSGIGKSRYSILDDNVIEVDLQKVSSHVTINIAEKKNDEATYFKEISFEAPAEIDLEESTDSLNLEAVGMAAMMHYDPLLKIWN